MCLMCVEIFKGRMTITEGRSALTELVATTIDPKELAHYRELESLSDEDFLEKAKEAEETAGASSSS